MLLDLNLVGRSRPAVDLHGDNGRLADEHVAENTVRFAVGFAGPGDGGSVEAEVEDVLGVWLDGGSIFAVETPVFARAP
jgi:hypothetical protein